ncbi:MAG: hypothetical protein JWN56_1752 [Sphingobacteriales bacterium]|nr:hypothetical protein [Sphingobacteriales bacterium]
MVFVGSGLSSTYTLIHYLSLLLKSTSLKKISITILEQSNHLWSGIPYGAKAGFNSLIITSLREFIPDPERTEFVDWIKINVNWIFNDFKKEGGELSESWLKKNESAIDRNEWDDLFIPRYIFGLYIKDKVTNLLQKAVNNCKIDYTIIKAQVTNIIKQEHLYKIIATGENNTEITLVGKKVILSIGSPPKHTFECIHIKTPPCIINDIYEPDISHNIQKIRRALLQSEKINQNNILIIGSNASALEAIYHLNDFSDLPNLINKFYVVSSAGIFPSRINKNVVKNYLPQHLTLLRNSKTFTSKKILEAVKKDVLLAETNNINIADTFNSISYLVIELLNRLNSFQQKRFVLKYGVEIGKYQRRAGNEYLDVVENLREQNKLENLKGRFIKKYNHNKSREEFNYLDKSSDSIKSIDPNVKVIIDCTGFQHLTSSSSSKLISNLISQKVCVTNESKNGFKVNENFEANKNLFLMGPLLAGNLNKNLRIWHAESCGRIITLSKQLANVLHQYQIKDKDLLYNKVEIPYQVVEQE